MRYPCALRGREALVRKVSHRKKRAYLSLTFAGRAVDAQVGLRLRNRPVRTVD